MSDIHNHFEEYLQLRAILGKDDHGYIVGDGIDRWTSNRGGIDLILSVMDDSNMTYLLGNHEQLMMSAMSFDGSQVRSETALMNWVWNGGSSTYKHLLTLPQAKRKKLFDFLYACSTEAHIRLENGKCFYLCHAWPDARGKLWGRPPHGIKSKWNGDEYLIFGHTVSLNLHPDPQVQLDSIQANHDHIRIVHSQNNNWSCIDCGAGYNFNGSALGMLRLEDMSEFYTKIDSV